MSELPITEVGWEAKLQQLASESEMKAWTALAAGKLWMFGYWAAKERQFRALLGQSKPSPWFDFVREARKHLPGPVEPKGDP